MPYTPRSHGFWDYTTPGTGGLERFGRDDYRWLLDDMAGAGMNSLALVVRWLTTGYASRLPFNDQLRDRCTPIAEGNDVLRGTITDGMERGIAVWLSASVNIFRADRVKAKPFSSSADIWGQKMPFEVGRYGTDQEEVCENASAMCRELVHEFPAMAGFVVEVECCGYELPHRIPLYNAWAETERRKPFAALGHPLNAREPDISDWRDFTTDNRAVLMQRLEATMRREGFAGRLAVFCETGRQPYLISQDVNLERFHARCPAWEAVSYDYSYNKMRNRLGMMELAIEEPKRAGMTVHYLPRGVMTYAHPETWPFPVSLAKHWRMDLEDIERFRPDGVWWFGADCSDTGAHVQPERLRGAGFADGAACRRALLKEIRDWQGQT